jgi:hypothetical protein
MPAVRKIYIPWNYSLPTAMIAGELVPHLEGLHCAVEFFTGRELKSIFDSCLFDYKRWNRFRMGVAVECQTQK